MNAPDAPARQDHSYLQPGLVDFHYRSLALSFVANTVNAILLAAIQLQAFGPWTVAPWAAAALVVIAARWLDFRAYHGDREARDSAHWERRATAGAVASGIIWGFAGGFLFPADDMARQAVLAFVLAGMAAGAVTTLSSLRFAVSAFLALTLLPLMINFLAIGTGMGLIMGFMTLLFLGSLHITARRMNHTIMESLEMRHANELAERHTRHQAHYDELTHLPNRRLLGERMGQELARSRRHGDMGALLFLDLDHFKNINDSLGHPAGDQVLKQVAQRLRQRVRGEDTAARLGGDEFVVLLSDLGDSEAQAGKEAGAFATELQRILSHTPYHAQGHELHVSTSIGITLFPVGEEDSDDLLRQADTAMYSAKSGGRDTVCFYRTDMQQAVNRRLQAEKDLRTAIANHQLTVFYQPMVDHHGHPFGVEALVRWSHPERGLITPDHFIPVAEESGIIFELGNWILRTACRDLARLRQRYGAAAPSVSINLSPRQFLLPGLADNIIAIAAETAADLNFIRLEVTESGLLDNVERAVEKMERLREHGVRFSIDDFGTGYSSLAYLKQLPVDTLKVDRSFIRDVLVDKDDAVIVETILAMANHLRLHSVAEGVETQEVVEFLSTRGCERFQGYLFARPIPFEELLGFIDARVPVNPQAGATLPN